ncbi:polyketide cyclase [Betaproteobacteria bacterium GR16-43]|nr:polyketide cyclase [Betaproteobacteria bacterium GR16-43]
MLKIIGLLLLVAIIAIVVIAALQPDTFRIERSIAIKAPPEKVQAQIADFHAWGAWSPWEKKDPAMKRTFGGPERGKGATYAWEGNKDVGSGRMEILVADPQKVAIKLEFLKPFEATNTAEFTLVPQGDTTTVTWAMFGPSNFIQKVMCLFMSMDKMVGPDFEAGLAALKASAEK